jgi:tRNA A-37 threonylcarbamoyl transferase component Bud32
MSESRYQIIERIAAGGMAEVYRGESAGIEGFRKKVAIKRVLPKLSSNREFINMFLDEARLCAYLNHSKCVQVFDIGQGNGSHFIVMEYVDGADLKHVLEYLGAHRQQMRVEVACLIAMGIAEGLAYAHQACDAQGRPLEIVHRDISPHNVLMTRFGEVKLVDFGLAKASSHLTAEDEDIVKGKFGYLAPEVTLGQGADKRVDIFAAGILLWEMLAGRRLFLGNSDVETFKLVQAANIPDPRESRRDIPDELIRVLARALARDRDQRYQTADELARDLSAVLVGLPRRAGARGRGGARPAPQGRGRRHRGHDRRSDHRRAARLFRRARQRRGSRVAPGHAGRRRGGGRQLRGSEPVGPRRAVRRTGAGVSGGPSSAARTGGHAAHSGGASRAPSRRAAAATPSAASSPGARPEGTGKEGRPVLAPLVRQLK